MKRRFKAVSLFSGAGGMDLGFRKAGFNIVWANDFNDAACDTYQTNLGKEIHRGSLMDYDYASLPSCDLVFGGPPCQGFSVAGKMDPSDPRSRLIFEFQKVVAVKRPRFFVMENVAALARLNRFAEVRTRLLAEYEKMGYAVKFKVLDSQFYKTPQRRERMIMIGTRDKKAQIAFPRHGRRLITAREVLSLLDEAGTGNNVGVCEARITVAKHPVLRSSPYSGMLFNGLGRPIDLDRPCQTLPASMGGNKTPFFDTERLRHPEVDDWLKVLHSHALDGEDITKYTVPPSFRRITVSEAAVLQGFPSGFIFCGPKCEQYRQIGNSVPPPFAYHIAKTVAISMQHI